MERPFGGADASNVKYIVFAEIDEGKFSVFVFDSDGGNGVLGGSTGISPDVFMEQYGNVTFEFEDVSSFDITGFN